MKTQRFLKLDGRFGLSGFLNPHIGGPYGPTSHLIFPGSSIEEHNESLAAGINYAAIRPFASLDLKSPNQWELNSTTDEWMKRHGGFNYNDWDPIVPGFVGDGSILTLIGAGHSRVNRGNWDHSVWSAIDKETSPEDLLHTIAGFIATDQVRFHNAWKLAYVLKTSWKSDNPKKKSYNIYIPQPEWVAEHATFKS